MNIQKFSLARSIFKSGGRVYRRGNFSKVMKSSAQNDLSQIE